MVHGFIFSYKGVGEGGEPEKNFFGYIEVNPKIYVA